MAKPDCLCEQPRAVAQTLEERVARIFGLTDRRTDR
jgi:hypothetical protein